MIHLTRIASRPDGVELANLEDEDLTLEYPDDIAALKQTLNAAGYDAPDKEIEWAWLQHSLDFCAGWLQLGAGDLGWLLNFLGPVTE